MKETFSGARWVWLPAALLLAGCHSRPATLGLQGNVSHQGQDVAWGKIDFIPVENTRGASACSPITDGRYEIPAKWGVLADGVYEVRITGLRKTGRTEPNRAVIGESPAEIAENYIPAAYNAQSTLRVRIAELADRNKVDFHLTAPQ